MKSIFFANLSRGRLSPQNRETARLADEHQPRCAFRPVAWPLRLVAGLLIIAQVNLSVPVLGAAMGALAGSETVATNAPAAEADASVQFVPAPAFWSGAEEEQIGACRLFAQPLLPVGKTTAIDNQDLQSALTVFARTNEIDFSALQKFLDTHPDSAWRPSLLTDLGLFFKGQGYFSRALQAWHQAWDLTSKVNTGTGKIIADRAGAEYVRLAASVGQADELEAMLNEFKGRDFSASVQPMILESRNALAGMRKNPALMYTCGPQALTRIHDDSGQTIFPPEIQDARNSKNGVSLNDLMHLANRIQMNYQMARRSPGAKIILPAVAHLKVGHYVAIVKEYQGRYLIQDPTAGNRDLWITPAALDDESSGYYLVHQGKLPAGWQPVVEAEGKAVSGRGPVTGFDNTQLKKTSPKSGGGCPPGNGMPFYSFHTMMVSLNIQDTPLGYQPTYGPAVNFTLTYNQRDTTQTTPWTYPNIGLNWTFDWLSYVEDSPSSPAADVSRYLPGGGEDTYRYDTTSGSFIPDYDSHATLIRNMSGTTVTSYEVDLPDGAKYFYAHSDGGTSPRRFYLTQQQDPQGNSIIFIWSSGRITQVKDAVGGRVTTVTYLSNASGSPDYYKIATVTDPFTRTATLTYGPADVSGERKLIGITDMAGMNSIFNYRSDGFIIGMTTPYGTTAFNSGESGTYRWLTATDPLGQTERLEFNQNAANPYIPVSDNSQLVPSDPNLPPLQNLNLYYRNSFFWSKKAMAAMDNPTTIPPSGYTNADIYHWCHTVDMTDCSGTLESFKRPLENRIWYRYPGQDPTTAAGAWKEGTNTQPIYVARVLDAPIGSISGPTQLYQYAYNDYSLLTVVTNPVGRITRFNYDPTTKIDLKEVRQDNQASLAGAVNGGDLLISYTYDSTYPRLVSTATDASGKTTTLTYGIHGLLASITDPRGKTTAFNYDLSGHSGFLHTVVGPVSGATTTFTADGMDRIKTVTDSDSHTVTYTYDNLDRATNVAYADNTFEQTIYTNLDPVLYKDRQGNWTGFEYDAQRHLVAVKDSLSRVTQYNWCSCGDLESIVDAQGGITAWMRDIQGRITKKIYPDMSATTFAYENTDSRLKEMKDAKGQTTHYDYNIDDTILRVTYPDAIIPTPSVTFAYNPKYNRLASMTDGTGTTTYGYYTYVANPVTHLLSQGAGRLSFITTSFNGSTVTYKYDDMGWVTNRAIDSVNMGYTFDPLGRLSAVKNVLGSFTYNYLGATPRLSSVIYPLNSQETDYAYYGSGDTQNHERLQTIQNKIGTGGVNLSKFDYKYDVLGRITNWARQFDSSTTSYYQFKYDAVNQLVGAILNNGTPASPGTLIKQYGYSYDFAGNRTGANTGDSSTSSASTSAFNNLNQLTKQTPGARINFAGTATAAGSASIRNLTINGVPALTTGNAFQENASVSTDNKIVTVVATDNFGNKTTNNVTTTVSANGTPTTLTYDLNGNLLSSATGTTVDAYDWDGADRLVAITHRVGVGLGTRTEFTYDGLGRRVRIVEKDSTGAVTSEKRYVWDGLEICEERDASNAKLKQYFPQGVAIGANNYYYTRDHLGSIRELVDSSSTIRARYDYDPYGKRSANQVTTSPIESDFGFTGHYYHAPSGLYLAPFRVYNADIGRWLNRDPIQETGGLNLYGYTRNNPVNLIDLKGLFPGMGGDADVNSGGVNNVPDLKISVPPCGGKATVSDNGDPAFLATLMAAGGVFDLTALAILGLAGPDEIVAGGGVTLAEGETVVGVVVDGQVVPESVMAPIASHAVAAEAGGALTAEGTLIDGAQAFTASNFGGQITVLGSGTFGGVLNVSDATVAAVRTFFLAQ